MSTVIEYLRSNIPCEFLFDGWHKTSVSALLVSERGELLFLVNYSKLAAHPNRPGIRFPQYPKADHRKIFEIWSKATKDKWENRQSLAHHYNDTYAPVYRDGYVSIKPNPECFRSIALTAIRDSIKPLELPF